MLRFAPLLTVEARRLRVAEDERDALVTDLLDDAILRVLEPGTVVPRSLAAYLMTSLRRRVLNTRRASARRVRIVREAAPGATDAANFSGRALVELDVSAICSEGTRRASAGPGRDAEPVAVSVLRLAELIARALTTEEQRLLEWVGNHVPQREIASWLGINYEAAGKRIRRLRARLIASSHAYLATLDPADRLALERLIERGTITRSPAHVKGDTP
ncbi:MAG: hypothetical protein ABJD07_05610 [Gemmatimonadaceae bacterium]